MRYKVQENFWVSQLNKRAAGSESRASSTSLCTDAECLIQTLALASPIKRLKGDRVTSVIKDKVVRYRAVLLQNHDECRNAVLHTLKFVHLKKKNGVCCFSLWLGSPCINRGFIRGEHIVTIMSDICTKSGTRARCFLTHVKHSKVFFFPFPLKQCRTNKPEKQKGELKWQPWSRGAADLKDSWRHVTFTC